MEDAISHLVQEKNDVHRGLVEDMKEISERLATHDERIWRLHDAVRSPQRRG